jgi:hypothetical protein
MDVLRSDKEQLEYRIRNGASDETPCRVRPSNSESVNGMGTTGDCMTQSASAVTPMDRLRAYEQMAGTHKQLHDGQTRSALAAYKDAGRRHARTNVMSRSTIVADDYAAVIDHMNGEHSEVHTANKRLSFG